VRYTDLSDKATKISVPVHKLEVKAWHISTFGTTQRRADERFGERKNGFFISTKRLGL